MNSILAKLYRTTLSITCEHTVNGEPWIAHPSLRRFLFVYRAGFVVHNWRTSRGLPHRREKWLWMIFFPQSCGVPAPRIPDVTFRTLSIYTWRWRVLCEMRTHTHYREAGGLGAVRDDFLKNRGGEKLAQGACARTTPSTLRSPVALVERAISEQHSRDRGLCRERISPAASAVRATQSWVKYYFFHFFLTHGSLSRCVRYVKFIATKNTHVYPFPPEFTRRKINCSKYRNPGCFYLMWTGRFFSVYP